MNLKQINNNLREVRVARRRLEFMVEYVFTGIYPRFKLKPKKPPVEKIKIRHNLQEIMDYFDNKKRIEKPLEFICTKEWKTLRRHVIAYYGAVCMKCGSLKKIQVDHIKPKSKHPELALVFNNLQVLCWDCNKEKSNKSEKDYRSKL